MYSICCTNEGRNPLKKQYFLVDLFAGAGGLSEGFHRLGFKTVAYVERDKYACQTLRTRHVYWKMKQKGITDKYYSYLRQEISKEELQSHLEFDPVINITIDESNLEQITNSIRENMRKSKTDKIDVFIGGPPCQAYSLIGRARDRYNMVFDERNVLYKHYVHLLQIFKPSIFVFENVPGILSVGKGQLWKDVREYFKSSGYQIDFRILDAQNFGVLQTRKRVILMGWKKELDLSYPDISEIKHNYLVRDLFSDLPFIAIGECNTNDSYITDPTKYLEVMGIRSREDILIDYETRPICDRDRLIYHYAIKKWNDEGLRLQYAELPSKLKTHRNENIFKDRFKVVAENLAYSHTMVAHIAKDGHHYIHPDINQVRSLTVREAARIQSFPDNYKFEGPRTAKFRQIGNAVPPLMAEKIAEKIKGMIL